MSLRVQLMSPPNHTHSVHVPEVSKDPRVIGEMLRAVTREQISEIYEKMQSIIGNSLTLKQNPMLRGGYVHVGINLPSQQERPAKDFLLGCLPVELHMINDFSSGPSSKLAKGESFEYSYEGMLAYAAITSGLNDALHQALGTELATKKDYRIRLDLDLEQMKTQKGLVFRIIETQGQEELSRTSFSLH
ncbi:MAG: hypothetical protein JSR39_08775 [Verrucomicrobia bacterium]|nr:hypothetical protein [Verrucomicrobiota bacterium]